MLHRLLQCSALPISQLSTEIRRTQPFKCFRKSKPSRFQSFLVQKTEACSKEQKDKKWDNILIYVHLGLLQSTSKIYHWLASCMLPLSLGSQQGRLGSKTEPWREKGQKIWEPGMWSGRPRKQLHRNFQFFHPKPFGLQLRHKHPWNILICNKLFKMF